MTEERETMTTENDTEDQAFQTERVSQTGTPDDELFAGESNDSGVVNHHTSEKVCSETTPDEETEPEVFPAKVVRDLRKENARYRERAQQSDALAQRLHVALVGATGKLADPTDLEFNEAHLEDPDALAAAVDELLTRKPHLKARRIAGDVGQGKRGNTAGEVDLLGSLRGLVG